MFITTFLEKDTIIFRLQLKVILYLPYPLIMLLIVFIHNHKLSQIRVDARSEAHVLSIKPYIPGTGKGREGTTGSNSMKF